MDWTMEWPWIIQTMARTNGIGQPLQTFAARRIRTRTRTRTFHRSLCLWVCVSVSLTWTVRDWRWPEDVGHPMWTGSTPHLPPDVGIWWISSWVTDELPNRRSLSSRMNNAAAPTKCGDVLVANHLSCTAAYPEPCYLGASWISKGIETIRN